MTAVHDRVAAVADAVLFEGYLLYPYRANDAKNRVRFQFGVLAPPAFAAADPSERTFLQCDCLVEGAAPTLTVQPRFLQLQRRAVHEATAAGFEPVASLACGDAKFLPWDEAVVQEPAFTIAVPEDSHAVTTELHVDGGDGVEAIVRDGRVVGRLVRTREPLDATLTVRAERMPGPYGVQRVRLRLENRTAWTPPHPLRRDTALRHALLAAHLVVTVTDGAFVSLVETPEWAAPYAERCEHVGAFPVLAGPPGDRSTVLASPIILYDHPEVAPESVAQFCDATEMDEMLTLRALTLTDEEKRQARGSDPRAAALVDQTLTPELADRLHGAIRSMTRVARPAPTPQPDPPPWWDPVADAAVDPDTDVVMVDGVPVGRGCAVRLRPGRRRADAQDMFLDGRRATVAAVVFDVDGGRHLAVELDELSAEGFNPHGRYLYFAPDEIEPVPSS